MLHSKPCRPDRRRGFTLVELMIVVVIVGVLAVVAMSAYRRHINAARKAEVYSMFGEIRAKEEAYRTEFSSYLQTGTEAALWPAAIGTDPVNWAPLPLNSP